MKGLRIIFLLISASLLFTSCSNFRYVTPKKKTIPAQEMASRMKKGRYYKIPLTDGTTSFIMVKKIEGTMVYGNLHQVDKLYYPLKDSAGKKIGTHPGSVNLENAVNVQKRKSTAVAIAVPVAFGVAFFLFIGSLGPWTGE